jgi:hypothetical protein
VLSSAASLVAAGESLLLVVVVVVVACMVPAGARQVIRNAAGCVQPHDWVCCRSIQQLQQAVASVRQQQEQLGQHEYSSLGQVRYAVAVVHCAVEHPLLRSHDMSHFKARHHSMIVVGIRGPAGGHISHLNISTWS